MDFDANYRSNPEPLRSGRFDSRYISPVIQEESHQLTSRNSGINSNSDVKQAIQRFSSKFETVVIDRPSEKEVEVLIEQPSVISSRLSKYQKFELPISLTGQDLSIKYNIGCSDELIEFTKDTLK